MDSTLFQRSLPENFNEKDRALFESEIQKRFSLPLEKVRTLKSIKLRYLFLYSSKMLERFSEHGILPPFNRGMKPSWIEKLKLKRKKYDHVNLVFDKNSNNYFHWITEVLPRVMHIEASGQGSKEYLLPDYVGRNPVFMDTLQHLIDLKRVTFLYSDEQIIISKATICVHSYNSGNYNPPVIQKLNRVFSPDPKTQKKRILILRNGIRGFANENEVVKTFTAFGFSTVRLEKLNFTEQLNLAKSCEILAGAHGAGLTNMIFLPEGGRVLELRFKNDSSNNCYFTLASDLRLPYYYMLCANNKNKLEVDINFLQKTLEACC